MVSLTECPESVRSGYIPTSVKKLVCNFQVSSVLFIIVATRTSTSNTSRPCKITPRGFISLP